MTVRVRVKLGTMGRRWEYSFSQRHDFLHAMRDGPYGKRRTLEGSWALLLDQDDDHTLMSIEVLPRSEFWQVQDELQAPPVEPGQVFVIEDIEDGRTQVYLTDPAYSVFYARLRAEESELPVQHVAIAEQIVLDIDPSGTLVGVWLLDLPPEIAIARNGSSTR